MQYSCKCSYKINLPLHNWSLNSRGFSLQGTVFTQNYVQMFIILVYYNLNLFSLLDYVVLVSIILIIVAGINNMRQ